mmetsp:Transcript_3728/g.9074  ORF Transcript_3728/g.9074 Transcript_3728/m.9074 type:complete len:206 (+) Transcript_3728:601-1218(+)
MRWTLRTSGLTRGEEELKTKRMSTSRAAHNNPPPQPNNPKHHTSASVRTDDAPLSHASLLPVRVNTLYPKPYAYAAFFTWARGAVESRIGGGVHPRSLSSPRGPGDDVAPGLRCLTPSLLSAGAYTWSRDLPAMASSLGGDTTERTLAPAPALPDATAGVGALLPLPPSSTSFFKILMAVGTTLVPRNMRPGTTPMAMAVSTSKF